MNEYEHLESNLIVLPNDFGAIVNDFNVTKIINTEASAALKDLLHRYKILIFKKQALSDEELIRFSTYFGELFTTGKHNPALGSDKKTSPIVYIGNNTEKYKQAYLGHQEVFRHSDHQWLEKPSSVSMLYAIEIDEGAPDTLWTDMVAAYQLLPKQMKERIADIDIITFNPFFRPFGEVRSKYIDILKTVPPGNTFPHPLVRSHSTTGDKILYLHEAYEMEFKDLDFQTGSLLHHHLVSHINSINCEYSHSWEKDDLVVWDNQSTSHYRTSFDGEISRVLKRISIAGSKPIR